MAFDNLRKYLNLAKTPTTWGCAALILSAVIALWALLPPAYRFLDHHHDARLAIAVCGIIIGLLLIIVGRGHKKDLAVQRPQPVPRPRREPEPGYPESVKRAAGRIKAALQMGVGLYAFGWLAWSFYLSHRIHNCVPDSAKMAEHLGIHEHFCYFVPPSVVAFGVVADALAAATVIQLAYTLFTPGPDEALDPALLALAAAFLLAVGQITSFKWQDGLAIVLYAVGFGLLFAVRVFLAPDEDSPPTLWWWRRRPSFWPKPARPR